ncbi:pimeloyl-ACP methyl ester carboxylesterase [Actinocorallia herbida]|uniref:Pimeloyl-ACP methyl ester carboxylesterase n=1 Tax=Actinocorallia herbida TaxID=58109 RepID=A0A3N1D0Q6_9ACTN|nr:alpha/beta hydrolase [Actinocorallia herbida]ROO87109.1 pimeloyl-ACP methyl ester carboxylesterase [Actinocorallia herbida]
MSADAPAGGLVDVGGFGLHVAETGTGRPTVLLHGGGPGCTAWSDFAPVVPRLAAGRRLILVDFAQYGASDDPDITGVPADFHAAALLALLDALGVAESDLVCQSLGGLAAFALAARAPERVRRLVVTGSQPAPAPPGVGSNTWLGLEARDRYYGGDGPSPAKMRDLLAALEWHDPSRLPVETVARRHAAATTPMALGLLAEPARRGTPGDLAAVLPEVTAPVLLLWGEHDPFAGPDYALSLAARLPRADLAVLGRTAHHPAEERPAAYALAVSAFLDGDPT